MIYLDKYDKVIEKLYPDLFDKLYGKTKYISFLQQYVFVTKNGISVMELQPWQIKLPCRISK